jgi:hypothetical protein
MRYASCSYDNDNLGTLWRVWWKTERWRLDLCAAFNEIRAGCAKPQGLASEHHVLFGPRHNILWDSSVEYFDIS